MVSNIVPEFQEQYFPLIIDNLPVHQLPKQCPPNNVQCRYVFRSSRIHHASRCLRFECTTFDLSAEANYGLHEHLAIANGIGESGRTKSWKCWHEFHFDCEPEQHARFFANNVLSSNLLSPWQGLGFVVCQSDQHDQSRVAMAQGVTFLVEASSQVLRHMQWGTQAYPCPSIELWYRY